jgi:hypothetical protein
MLLHIPEVQRLNHLLENLLLRSHYEPEARAEEVKLPIRAVFH